METKIAVREIEKYVKAHNDNPNEQLQILSAAQTEAAKTGDEWTINALAIAKRRIIRRQVTK